MDPTKAQLARGQFRSISRQRGVMLFCVATLGIGLAIRYQANALRDNELAQKNSATPNLYVSVDRSGGGI